MSRTLFFIADLSSFLCFLGTDFTSHVFQSIMLSYPSVLKGPTLRSHLGRGIKSRIISPGLLAPKSIDHGLRCLAQLAHAAHVDPDYRDFPLDLSGQGDPASSDSERTPFWQNTKPWKHVSEQEFLSQSWQVSFFL